MKTASRNGLGLGCCPQGVYAWPLEEHTQQVIQDFKGFAKGQEVAKTNKAVVEMANNLNLGADEGLGMVPEVLTNAELLEMEEECLFEEGAREREMAGKEKHPRRFTVKGLAEVFADFIKLFEKFEDMDPPAPRHTPPPAKEKFSLIERTTHYLLVGKSVIKKN